MSDVHDMSYYGKCMVGGIFACGITHAAVCPLDIVKCRRQVSNRAHAAFARGTADSRASSLVFDLLTDDMFVYCRLTQAFTAASVMASERSTPLRASRASLS